MSTAGAIRVGKAFIELFADDKLTPALKQASGRLKAFGASVAKVGATLSAAGLAGLTAFGGAISKFVATGDALDKLSIRTGIGVKSLQQLQFAASQSGASAQELEIGLKNMSRVIGAAANGSTAAEKSLSKVGTSVAELLSMSPEERFRKLASGVAAISDPGLQAAAAMELFGRSGDRLLPLLKQNSDGIAALQAEASRLNLDVLTPEDTANAARTGDLIDQIQRQMAKLFEVIGAKLAPVLIPFLERVTEVAAALIDFANNNEQLIQSVAAGAAILFGAGGILASIGGTIALIGIALPGIATAFSALATIIGAVFSPIGAIVAVVAVGIAAIGTAVVMAIRHFLLFTEAGRYLTATLVSGFRMVWRNVMPVIEGIWNALKSGQWKLAASIAVTGMLVAWETGLLNLRIVFERWRVWVLNILDSVVSAFADRIAKLLSLANAAGAGSLFGGVQAALADFASGSGSRSESRQSQSDALLAEANRKRDALNDSLQLLIAQAGAQGGARKITAPETSGGLGISGVASGTASAGAFNAAAALRLGNNSFQKQRLENDQKIIAKLTEIALAKEVAARFRP